MILVIDNYDSFTYNLVQYLGVCGVQVEVVRNDRIDLRGVLGKKPAGVMLSPGPCSPRESGVCLDILGEALRSGSDLEGVPIFGVCLGHQAVGHVAGGVVERAQNIMHGKASQVSHDSRGLFAGMPNPFRAIRYHSLVVREETLPPGFCATAHSTDDGEVMGLRHESLPIEGVQFHPESVMTEQGMTLIENFVKWVNDPSLRVGQP
ncbi:MAG: aminodeoxychorismate/anthranilate synthase component II [Fimbriimonadaceae bacterium]|jgi:anthranilate synthase/aminodeoxychorismate synthase-like glutamine amidotransferase|nr:aminodeoxychorismate/anthranilate synthase component II [Fimbriimonadaceae bacterium]